MVDPYGPRETGTVGGGRMAWADRSGGGVWWLVAAAGIGVLLLADLIAFFDSGHMTAAGMFATLGSIALVGGLTLSALLGTRWPWGARVALMLGAAFLATDGIGGSILF